MLIKKSSDDNKRAECLALKSAPWTDWSYLCSSVPQATFRTPLFLIRYAGASSRAARGFLCQRTIVAAESSRRRRRLFSGRTKPASVLQPVVVVVPPPPPPRFNKVNKLDPSASQWLCAKYFTELSAADYSSIPITRVWPVWTWGIKIEMVCKLYII